MQWGFRVAQVASCLRSLSSAPPRSSRARPSRSPGAGLPSCRAPVARLEPRQRCSSSCNSVLPRAATLSSVACFSEPQGRPRLCQPPPSRELALVSFSRRRGPLGTGLPSKCPAGPQLVGRMEMKGCIRIPFLLSFTPPGPRILSPIELNQEEGLDRPVRMVLP